MKTKEDKIGFLIISPNWAGAENFLKNLVCSLSKLKVKSLIYCNKEVYPYYKEIKKARAYNIGILNIGSKLRYLNYLSMLFLLRKFVSKERPDALFMIMEGSFFVSFGIRNHNKMPIFVTLHGDEIYNFVNSEEKIKNYFLTKWLKKSPRIISVSNHQIQNLPEKYKKKTVVIPNGVDPKMFKPLKRIKQKRNVILFTGRFIDIKGIKEILTIAKQLPQYEFWFAGQGELSHLIKGKNIKNLGFQKTEDLVKLYNQATICIFPSHREAFGNVGLEAMSCQRAIIATPFGFSEYIENGKDGIIIPAKDENALKNAIVKLMINKKLRKKIEKNARKKALKYSWDKVAKQYLKVFKQIISNSKQNKI